MNDNLKAAFDAVARFYDSLGEWPLAPRGPMSGPNAKALKAWVAENMPDLDAELGPMPLAMVRERLNEITGCEVQASDPVEITCGVFLAALQAQHASKEAPP